MHAANKQASKQNARLSKESLLVHAQKSFQNVLVQTGIHNESSCMYLD
jgi:hypothetical protein